MISMKNERRSVPISGLCGGVGITTFHPLFERGVLPSNVTPSTLEPGASCGEHLHDKDTEIYFILEGEMTVTDKDGNKYVMGPMESISFPPNEGRGLKNESDKPAKMLVIINYPEAK